ncbi:MAG TPA: molybdate ABC transporter substrate-binding protein, partial [Gaiellaceae bacterium]|nr:molybdate ABC transporter substrate-binding protein [Gaiellaceae bacterium]
MRYAAVNAALTIFAAASLTTVFPQIDAKQTYSFAGSNALAAQIRQGAPADVFASANTAIPQQLYAEGLAEKPVVFTRNALILIVPKSNPAHVHSVYDLRRKGVKLVVAAPGVPVGDYTRTVLHHLG